MGHLLGDRRLRRHTADLSERLRAEQGGNDGGREQACGGMNFHRGILRRDHTLSVVDPSARILRRLVKMSLRNRLSSLRLLSSGRAWLGGKPHVLAGAIIAIALILLVSATGIVWFAYDVTAGLPDRSAIRGLGDMAQATTILDARDTPVFTIFKEQRIDVPLKEISPNLIKAVVSVEDQRFYEHSGVDFVRVAAAFVRNVQEGRRAEGGSTITQQLARQSFLSRDKTLRRKMKRSCSLRTSSTNIPRTRSSNST